jgi:hypothetical protein
VTRIPTRAAPSIFSRRPYSDIFSKRGTTVAPELIDQVARMRARSNELLMEALAMLKAWRAASMFPHK